MLNKIKQIFKDKKIYKKPIVIIISILIMSSGIFASFKIIQNKNNQEPQEVMAQKLKKVETIILDMNNDDAFIETIGAIKPETQIDVTANIGGSVKNIYFNIGDDVYVNKLLASLYDGAVLTGLNNAQTNYANMQNNLSSTEILGNEAIRQAEIGVQSAEETIKSAEIALNSAQDNLANIKTLKDKNKIDVKTNAIISFNSYLNSIFNALNQINQILDVEDGTAQITGIEYVLGVKKLSTVHIAETSYRAAKNQYDILKKATPNTEDIKEKMLDMINCLSLVKQSIDDTLEVINNTISSSDFNETALSNLKQSLISLHASFTGTQTGAENTLQILQNINLSYNQEIITLENSVKAAENNLIIAQTGYINALASLETAQRGQDQKKLSSQISLDSAGGQLNLARTQAGDLSIKSPIAGKITKKLIEVGTEVGPGQKIAEVSQIDNLKIEVSISSEDVYRINKEAEVIIGDGFVGKISSIDPVADPITKKVKITILFNNKNKELISGTFTDVLLPIKHLEKTHSESIYIPLRAVTITQNGSFVFIVKTNEKNMPTAQIIQITTGKTEGNLIEVIDGLNAQDELIVEGGKILEDGERVEIMN